jgi:cysteine-rich repeat protein
LTTADSCYETCGDGLHAGGLDCDDGNTSSGDGCSSTCTVEVGYNCTGGTITTPDTCVEICGDGLNFGHYNCDDKNNVNGDGCDEYCNVESGWFCEGGTSSNRYYCY